MRVALGADETTHSVAELQRFLEKLGHEVTPYGSLAGNTEPWAASALAVANAVAARRCDFGIVWCWTGTGVCIAANKVPGIRAALCSDAETARGARRWNDANVLALSLRLTTAAVAQEIVTAWLAEPYGNTEAPSLLAIQEAERRQPNG